jgi:hypothetical protein
LLGCMVRLKIQQSNPSHDEEVGSFLCVACGQAHKNSTISYFIGLKTSHIYQSHSTTMPVQFNQTR